MAKGYSHWRLYRIWNGMKQRCCNKNNPNYCNYGGRGITVCDEWRDNFEAFYEWALTHGYKDPEPTMRNKRAFSLSIDRIDNRKGYSPENCQWITMSENVSKRKTDFPRDKVAVHEFLSWADMKSREIAEKKFHERSYWSGNDGRKIRDFISFGVIRQLGINKITCMEEADVPKARAYAEKVFALFA